MKVSRRYDQHRRDLTIDMKCENCKATDIYNSAYDDRNFWDNVVPDFKCKKCGKSSNDLGIQADAIATHYPEGFQI